VQASSLDLPCFRILRTALRLALRPAAVMEFCIIRRTSRITSILQNYRIINQLFLTSPTEGGYQELWKTKAMDQSVSYGERTTSQHTHLGGRPSPLQAIIGPSFKGLAVGQYLTAKGKRVHFHLNYRTGKYHKIFPSSFGLSDDFIAAAPPRINDKGHV
jgi:hypothetical protein